MIDRLAVAAMLFVAIAARGEVTVTAERAPGDPQWKLARPPRQNSATAAAFTLVDGEADRNSAPLDALHDGELPEEADQPDRNFFFKDGSRGGRLLIDLGKVIPVKELDTYSWHPNSRAPQVYEVYGSDGSGPGFAAQPHGPGAPPAPDWKWIARVDTRAQHKLAGGQYGVCVADTTGLLGNFRYLLFDLAATETDDPFGNTFYSEINVLNRDAPTDGKPIVGLTTRPAKQVAEYDKNGYHLTFTSDDPTFNPKEQDRLVQTFFAVYPKMAAEYNRNASRAARISLERKYRGVAATEGNHIHCNPAWFHQHPEDIDVITHEAMHIAQAYRQWDPAWLREGIADYVRNEIGVNNRAAHWDLPDYEPGQSYKDAYRVTARFLLWLEKKVKPGIVVTMDKVMRDGAYAAETWKQQTGKSVDELWEDYGKNPAL